MNNNKKEINLDEIKQWYLVEKDLANKLRNSTRTERKLIYKTLYDDLFRRVPQHSRLRKSKNEKNEKIWIRKQIEIIDGFINKDSVFMEVGPGDCTVALEISKKVKHVYAVDISDELIKKKEISSNNFEFIISDGDSIDVPANSVDVAYSNQFIEHLHPDDTGLHMQNIQRVLKPGGVYIFMTPHRFKGPHDISKYFDEVATGFHLKEWIFSELISLLNEHKFSKTAIFRMIKQHKIGVPVFFIKVLEYLLGKLPYYPRKRLSMCLFRGVFFIVAVK